jgi:hypothetical protein
MADGAGDDHKGDVDADFLLIAPGVQASEAWQVVIRQHQVVVPGGKLPLEVGHGVHQRDFMGHLPALQGELHQRVIDPRIF